MLLKNKTVVIYGAAGAVGSSIAETFAREGAFVVLTGRDKTKLDILAQKITAAGGIVQTGVVDALDEASVEKHLDTIIKQYGGIDISFNAIGLRNTKLQGISLTNIGLDEFMAPVISHVQANFLTARHAGRHMIEQGFGVIMNITSIPSRVAIPLMGGVAIAMAAEEALIRNLSAEFGPKNVRVIGLRPQGMIDSDTITEVHGLHAKAYGIKREEFRNMIEERNHLKRSPTLQEMAEVAAFMGSDRATAMAGTIVNMSMGTIAD